MRKIISLVCLFAALFVCLDIVYSAEVHEAAKSGDIVKLEALLDKDPGLLYSKDEQGKTPLHWATGRGQLEAIKVLLDKYHTDINVRNNNEGTPLHVAASQAQAEAAKILIQHKALIDARTKDGATPLHFAAFKGRKSGHIEVARMLIENGADVNAKMNNGATPLSMALSRQNSEIISLLKSHGAKGQVQRSGGMQGGGSAMGWGGGE